MVKSLNTKWKEFLFAFSGFGPNFLMVLMGAYFSDAINPAALGQAQTFQAIAQGTCFVLPALFPILYTIAKVFDGIIDVPFAHITDTLSTKWGRRRPAIAACAIPMMMSFAMCWIPVGGADGQLFNTIWMSFWALVFFATYTMCLIAFYGSLSTVCTDEHQRLRVSGYKSFFDTISYCFVYALVPLVLDGLKIHIDKFVFLCLPLMLTIIIPLFMIKEGKKYGYPENEGLKPEKISIFKSIKITLGNKIFSRWLVVYGCMFFGLQMFLVAMNAMIIGGMGFNGAEMALANTCAFAPVPVMLYLFNKLKGKKGLRFTYQTCLLGFAVSILAFFFASKFIVPNNKILQYAIICTGSVCGSWSIGAFFMMPYLVPAQVSSVEEKLTGVNHSAMYFATQALFSSIVSAISATFVYENLKMLFFKKGGGLTWAENIGEAAEKFGVETSQVFNFGTLIIPFIVSVACIIGYFLSFGMPKNYTPDLVARELKKFNPDLDISKYEEGNYVAVKEDKGEIIFVQIGLTILSGFIFGFIWLGFMLKSLRELVGTKRRLLWWALCSFVPFVSVYFVARTYKLLSEKLARSGKKPVGCIGLWIAFGVICPLLPMNIVLMALVQNSINRAYATEDLTEE